MSSSYAQSLKSSVNEVIDAIDTQLSKQEDIQKKKVCRYRHGCTVVALCTVCQLIIYFISLYTVLYLCPHRFVC